MTAVIFIRISCIDMYTFMCFNFYFLSLPFTSLLFVGRAIVGTFHSLVPKLKGMDIT